MLGGGGGGAVTGATSWPYALMGVEPRERMENTMQAVKGDRLVIKGHHISEPDSDGEILEVRGPDGSPPYLVRWSEDGRVGLVFPGPDAHIQHFAHH